MKRRQLMALAGVGAPALAGPLLSAPALAQGVWQPDRPIRITVPFPPGGATDVWARLVAEHLGDVMRANFVVENRSGAAGMIGAEAVARAQPDGHSLLFTITALVQSPVVLRQNPYDAVRDFTPIGQMGTTTLIFMSRAALGPRNLDEFIAYARQRAAAGRGLMMGSWAAGSTAHVFGLVLNNRLNLGMTHVAYRGEAPMLAAYLAQEIDCGINSLTTMRPHIESGTMVPLAALGDARAGGLPNVPTFVEQGHDIGRGWAGFVGMLAPARLPERIHTRLADAFRETMTRPALQARLRQMDTDPIWLGPAEFGEAIARIRAQWIELTAGMDLQMG